MRNKTVYAIIAIFLIQAFSASLAVIPAQNDVDLFFPESSDTSARNNSSGGGNTTGGGNNTGGGNTTGGGNSTGGGNTTGGGNNTGGGNTTGGGNSTGGGNTTGGGNNTGGGNTTGGGNNTGGGNTGGGNGMANNNSSGSGGGTGGVKPGGNTSGGNGTSSNNTANTNSSTNGSGTGGIKPGANNTNGTGMAGTTPWNPLLPVLACSDIPWNNSNITANITIDDCLNSTSDFWFWFNQSGSLVWVDPIVATGYDFVVYSGPAMVTVEIPPGYGDDVFDLYLHDGTDWYDTNIDIDAGVSYTFQSPVDRMSIRGIETYEMLDPSDPTAFVTGITYASNGTVLMTMTPVTTNYTLPACGTDPSLTDLMIWTDLQTYQQGSTTFADYYVNCSVTTKDYELHAFAYSTSGTSWSDFQVWNWTETDAYEMIEDDWTNLDPATYCINATLYMVSGNAYQFVDFEVTCFTVVGNNSGGGSGGGTTIDPCGLNSSYTVLMSWSDAQTYNYGEDQNMSFYVNCTRIGESYTLEYFVYDITAPSNVAASGTYSWMATNIWEGWNDVVTGLLPGDYCVDTDLYQANIYLTSGYSFTPHCFDVTGVSVNSPPTLTQTLQALVAYADDPLNCYDNGMVYSDPNNDPDQSIITWFVNNAQVATGVQALLPAGTVSVGDQLSCEATAHDGFMAGNTVTRSYYVLPANNTAPSVSAITISPTSPEETDTLTCTYTYMDPDNDPDASIIIWSINGVATTTQGATLSTGYTTADFVTCSVTAFDGSSAGNTGTGTVLIMSPGGGSTPTIGVLGTLAVLSVAFILISRKELED